MAEAAFDIQRAFEGVHARLNSIQEDTTASKTQLKILLGNGQPGRVGILESKVSELVTYKENAKGYLAALAAVVTFMAGAMHFLVDLFKHK